MTTTNAQHQSAARFTHKATGINWHYSTDANGTARYVLRLSNPRRRSPATWHRFVTAGHRDKYVARCLENAAQVDRDIAANFYPTPPEATRALLSVESFDGPIWEPACGQGHIAKVLEAQGHEVIATDLNAYGYGAEGIDFLNTKATRTAESARHIVTNPPYGQGLADAFIERALAVTAKTGGKVAMLLNLAALAQEQRTPAWQKNPPARLYAIDGVVCWPETERKPPKHFLAHRYVWAVWEHGHKGPSAFWWLSSKEFRDAATPPKSQNAPRSFAGATALLMNGAKRPTRQPTHQCNFSTKGIFNDQ